MITIVYSPSVKYLTIESKQKTLLIIKYKILEYQGDCGGFEMSRVST